MKLFEIKVKKEKIKMFDIDICTNEAIEGDTALLYPKRSPYIRSELDFLARACIIKNLKP